MNVSVSILEGPLPASPSPGGDDAARPGEGVGAWLVFEGLVRGREGDRAINALEYQTYEPMAQQMLARLGREVGEKFGLHALHVQHSRGRVGVGECSFRLSVAA